MADILLKYSFAFFTFCFAVCFFPSNMVSQQKILTFLTIQHSKAQREFDLTVRLCSISIVNDNTRDPTIMAPTKGTKENNGIK